MEYQNFGASNKQVSRLGFGGWQLGNKTFWGDMDFDSGVSLVQAAIKQGITFFDTAPGYAEGMSEMIIGAAIKNNRDQLIINSKIGHLADGSTDFSVESLKSQIEASLVRLNTSYLDSVLLHNPDFAILSGKTKHFEELRKIQDLGLIKAYGVSIDTENELRAVLTNTDCQVVEILFNIFFQAPSKLFDLARKKQITLIVKVPLDSGWLSGKYDETAVFSGIRDRWSPEIIKRRAALVKELKAITKSDDLVKYALAFILSFPAVTTVIPGTKNQQQLISNLEAASFNLSETIKQKFIKLYDELIKDQPLPW